MKYQLDHRTTPSYSSSSGHKSRKNGFTLLEVILAMSIMAILVGSVFTITKSSIQLSQSVVDNQKSHRHKIAFESYLDTLCINLPQDSKIELLDDDTGFQVLTIHNPGTYFPSFQNDLYASLFEASTSKNRDGLLDLKTTWQSLKDNSSNANLDTPESQQSLSLIGDLTSIQWEIYSTKDKLWYRSPSR